MVQGPCAHLRFKCWDMGIVAWVTLKSRYYAMYPCTYDKNLETIQPLVQELYQLAKLRIRQDWNFVCELLLPSGTYVQSFGPTALNWFSKMAAWWPYLNSDRAEVW
jgi:hypothetical protein